MLQVLGVTYLGLKAGHVIFVIFWMAGLFMPQTSVFPAPRLPVTTWADI